jgi:hypothetical protein
MAIYPGQKNLAPTEFLTMKKRQATQQDLHLFILVEPALEITEKGRGIWIRAAVMEPVIDPLAILA